MIDKINNDKSKPSDNIDIISSYSRSSSYQYLFKIILIGDSFTGKTSLINRYIHKSFADKYLCTIGVDFTMKAVELTDKTNIKLQIWDTAGMERYKQITTSYYRGAQACIIVFDLTNKYTFENLNKWVREYNKYHNPLFEKNIILVVLSLI